LTWHLVARTDAGDDYTPAIDEGTPRLVAVFDDRSHPGYVSNDALDRIQAGGAVDLPAVVVDLLYLAMTVYCADLRVKRVHGAGRWERNFVLHLPVSDRPRWTAASSILSRMLAFLTGDRWTLVFREGTGPGTHATKGPPAGEAPDVVSLLSGGLDSLVGALDLLASGRRVALVGHHGAGMTNSIQAAVLDRLTGTFRDHIRPFMFYVQPPRSLARDSETTMRARSVLFIALGLAVAASMHVRKLVIAENGLISLNVPLTPARAGSSSTRTTHPHFLGLFRDLLRALELPLLIETPYSFATKGEMLRHCRLPDLLSTTVPATMSCSHPEAGRFRGHSPSMHCGYCVPCIIRRASLRAAGLPEGDYSLDAVASPPSADTATGRDLRAFEMAIERLDGARPSRYLADVLGTGPIPARDAARHAGVYRRGIAEVSTLLG
jgi:hypothetical protein